MHDAYLSRLIAESYDTGTAQLLLDHGIWWLPLAGLVALAVFPWRHWNQMLDTLEGGRDV